MPESNSSIILPRNNIVELAVEEANQSSYKIKVGSVIFDKKRIISVGRNYSLKSIKHLHPQFIKFPGSVHAEVEAIIKARRDLKGCSILVVRVNNRNEFRLSKPCIECTKYLQYVGIKKVFYSISCYPYIELLKL